MTRWLLIAALTTLTPLYAACDRDRDLTADAEDDRQIVVDAYPDGVEGLDALLRDLSRAVRRGDTVLAVAIADTLWFKDPEAWFVATYGEEVSATLLHNYRQHARSDALMAVIAQQLEKGRAERSIERFDDPADPLATSYQSAALEAQLRPSALFSLRFVVPGERSGFHLHNFVRAEGGWRLAGIMKGLTPGLAGDPKLDAVGSLRHRDRERFFETGELPR